MPCFDDGVKRFIKTRAIVYTSFPVDWRNNPAIACKHCNFFVRATNRCGLNQQIVNFPDLYVGSECPLELIEEEEGEENE